MVLYGSECDFQVQYENEFGGVRDIEIPFEEWPWAHWA